MPKKIRELKAMLLKAGFIRLPGKGGHAKYAHASLPETLVVISGSDGNDAQRYQEKDVRDALAALEEMT